MVIENCGKIYHRMSVFEWQCVRHTLKLPFPIRFIEHINSYSRRLQRAPALIFVFVIFEIDSKFKSPLRASDFACAEPVLSRCHKCFRVYVNVYAKKITFILFTMFLQTREACMISHFISLRISFNYESYLPASCEYKVNNDV